MKKTIFLSGLIFLLLACNNFVSAQKKYPASFYHGDWDFEVKDIPNTEISGSLNVHNTGNKLASYLINDQNGDTIHVNKIAVADTCITLFFTAMNQDIALTLHPKDNKHMDGIVMGMYAIVMEKRND